MSVLELIILAAEPAKQQPTGMTFERWLTLAGFVLSATLGIITLLKFLKERKEAKEVKDTALMKAPAEKDVIIVTGAQSAVLMMEQAAKSAREEADRYKADLTAVRAENEILKEKIRVKDEKIEELQTQVRAIRLQLDRVTEELTEFKEHP